MKKKKLKLKKKWKDLLVNLLCVACSLALIIAVIKLYNWRVEQTKGKKPGSVHISELFEK